MADDNKNGTQSKSAAARLYRVKSPLRHNGKDYEIGSKIWLTPKEAGAIPGHVLELHREEKAEE